MNLLKKAQPGSFMLPGRKDNLLTFKTDNPNQIYKKVVKQIIEKGNKVSPRGQLTYEIQPAIHEITNPHKKLCTVPGRKANPFFNMAENMWILAGHGNADWISSFNNKLNEFQGDEGKTDYNAPYGRRIRFANRHRDPSVQITPYTQVDVRSIPQVDQILHCYHSLKNDKDSRQAVISLWNPVFDNFHNKTKDRPCNTTIYFKIRNDKLNMTVSNRSNDVHLGLYGVNFVQFSTLQEFLAASLGIECGQYIHISDSLHIYENSQHTKNILEATYNFNIYDYVNPSYVPRGTVEDIFKIPDMVISNSQDFRKKLIADLSMEYVNIPYYSGEESIIKYSNACSLYLYAYDAFKIGNYELAIMLLIEVSATFKMDDWVIAGFEFMMRKKEFVSYFEKEFSNYDWYDSNIINFHKTLDMSGTKRVVKWLHGH